ncbi:MAG: NAD(P)H-dependent oxidoreductase [Bacteroides sp.]|nr:MAG: NAD(P)H-dependent oxidoreductase [Bacteroides sp.]
MIKCSIIIGSTRQNRKTPTIYDHILKKFKIYNDFQIEIFDIKKYNLPIFDDVLSYKSDQLFKIIKNNILISDNFIFISPEYNGGIPGVLKNFLDYFNKEFNKKPIGIITCSSGYLGGINASNDLYKYLFHMQAYVSPNRLIIPNINDTKKIKYSINIQLDTFLDDFVWLAKAVYNYKKYLINQKTKEIF